MGVPFEALIPYGIVIGMFTVAATGISYTKHFTNEGKKPRWNNDLWDRQSKLGRSMNIRFLPKYGVGLSHRIWANIQSQIVMERDLRLTGSLRGQINNPQAPKGFEVSKPWKVENRIF
ncbi:hypothetical protein N7470_005724 [Penicillium chermesinum]|nr:hypothetical protein N7470_005724 [Penicillium chermesinum]